VRIFELCALEAAPLWSGGDRASYFAERVLPLVSLGGGEPVIDPAEVDDLDECRSLLEAMVEVLPWTAPPRGEGAIVAPLGDDELTPLAPWARPGQEYAGAIFRLEPERLLGLCRALDGAALSERVQRFEHAWYRAARPGMPEGDAFETWRRVKAEEGAPDVERVLGALTELRLVLELAQANRLQPALLFYEGA
jgi:hypothetical protein